MRAPVLLLLAGLAAACTLPERQPTTTPATPPAAGALVQGIVAEVNRVRRDNGLADLQTTPAYTRAAQGHAQELARRLTLDHTSLDPARRTMTMRIEAEGGTWRRAAENLASLPGPQSAVPAAAARMWLGSPGHRRNLLDAGYTHTGVGAAQDINGQWYIVQLYVTPR